MLKSRKKHRVGKWALAVQKERSALERAEWYLSYLNEMLAGPCQFNSDEWLWIATLTVDADQALTEAAAADPATSRAHFDEVMEELRKETANFTNVDFLRSSRAARRHSPALFVPRPKS